MDIFWLSNQYNIIIDIDWIPRAENRIVDYLSKIVDLDDCYYQAANSHWGPFTVDCFANSANAKVSRFYSLFFQPGCLGVDSLAFEWGNEDYWLVPSVHLIPRALVHCKSHRQPKLTVRRGGLGSSGLKLWERMGASVSSK